MKCFFLETKSKAPHVCEYLDALGFMFETTISGTRFFVPANYFVTKKQITRLKSFLNSCFYGVKFEAYYADFQLGVLCQDIPNEYLSSLLQYYR